MLVVVVVGFEDLAVSRVLGFSGGPGLRLHVSSISVCVCGFDHHRQYHLISKRVVSFNKSSP